jgi:hypothetical protein
MAAAPHRGAVRREGLGQLFRHRAERRQAEFRADISGREQYVGKHKRRVLEERLLPKWQDREHERPGQRRGRLQALSPAMNVQGPGALFLKTY